MDGDEGVNSVGLGWDGWLLICWVCGWERS